MESNTPPPSSRNPSSNLSQQHPPAQPLAFDPTTETVDTLFHRIATYSFSSDPDYLTGLASILGHPGTFPTEAELTANEDLVLQAQCFYFTRKFGLAFNIDVGLYKVWLTSKAATATPETAPPSAPALAANEVPISPADLPPRPHAPTPNTAAAVTTLDVQPHQQLASPGIVPVPSVSTSQSPSSDPTPPYPTSFADIVELITENKPIPGIETVPDTVLEPGTSKIDRTIRRRKPWETDAEPEGAPSEATDEQSIDVEKTKETGDGVVKILQPGAIPDSGLMAKE